MRCYAHVIPIKSMRSSDCVEQRPNTIAFPMNGLMSSIVICTALQVTTNVEAMADNLGVEQAEASAIVPEAVTKQAEADAQPKSPLSVAVLDYVAKDYRIIPTAPNQKIALLKDWHKNALEIPEAVDAFYEHNPNANIAFCPEDMGIAPIDCDPGADLSQFPPTYTVKTPRDGDIYIISAVCRQRSAS